MMRARTTELVVSLSLVMWALIAGGLLYETLAVVPAWTADLPSSVAVITEQGVNPGRFWEPTGMPHILLTLAALALAWKDRARRKWLLVSAAVLVLIYVMQFGFFWPRNVRMDDPTTSPDVVVQLAGEWVAMNRLRIVYVMAGFLATLRAFGLGSRTEGAERSAALVDATGSR